MNDCITTTKQSTTKPCAYFLGYTIRVDNNVYMTLLCEDITLCIDELSVVGKYIYIYVIKIYIVQPHFEPKKMATTLICSSLPN